MKIAFISHASVLNGAPISLAELVEEVVKDFGPGSVSAGFPVPGPLLEKYDLPGAEVFFYAAGLGGREIIVTHPKIRRKLGKIFNENILA